MVKRASKTKEEVEEVDEEEEVVSKKKPTKTNAKKPTKKPTKKAKDTEDDEDEAIEINDETERFFKRIYPKEGKSSGRYSKGPHQAGLKAFNQYQIKCEKSNTEVPKSVKIYIQETTEGSRKTISCYKCIAGEGISQKRLKPDGDPDNEDDYII